MVFVSNYLTTTDKAILELLVDNAAAEVDIVFNAGPCSAAKFRRAASSFELIITASVTCSASARQLPHLQLQPIVKTVRIHRKPL